MIVEFQPLHWRLVFTVCCGRTETKTVLYSAQTLLEHKPNHETRVASENHPNGHE